ncbi:MAG: T9SS type A sorting domain-containing protein [Chitinophagaceae bacterium]|nr:T9SS type A sorting domain-containing protein [Chitinophagaceae bacterium]MCW5925482.1 T9SS type A sorting domain-containing protein [Chitinophagaceae bacterium]
MKKHLLTSIMLMPFLLFSQQTYIWNASSGQWHNPTAWSPQRTSPLPDDILEFGISAAITEMPATDLIGRLRVHNNATVNISSDQPATVSVGESSIAGAHFLMETGSTLSITGNNTVSFHITAGSTGRVDGYISLAGGAHRLTSESPGSLVFRNGARFTSGTGFSGNAFGTTYLNSVIFENGATYISTAGANPFGAPTPAAVAVFENGSSYIHRTNSPVPALSGRTYGNLVIDANVNFAGIGSARDCIIQNNLLLTSGFFSFKPNSIALHTGNFFIGEDIICEGNSWIDIGNTNMTGAVELNGNNQAAGSGGGTGTIRIFNLRMNNSTTILHRPLYITGNLNLQNGRLTSSITSLLVLETDAATTGCAHDYGNLPHTGMGCDNSFVEGPVQKLGLNNGSFAFPVGINSKLRPLLLHEATGDFVVEYIRGDPYTEVGNTMGAGIHHISHLEYWNVNGTGSARVELTYYDPNSGGVTDMNALRAVRFDGIAWQDQGVSSFTGFPGSNGSVTSLSITDFGYFSLASSSEYPNNPLPARDYFFSAGLQTNRVRFQWNIYGEQYEKFIVEKLVNDTFIEIIYNSFSENTAYDENLFEGKNIYRMKIISRSGEIYFTDNKEVMYYRLGHIQVYPNPAREKILIKIPAASSISELLIVNISGSILKRVYPRQQTAFEISVLDLPPGIYFLRPCQTHLSIGRFIKLN